MACSVHVVLVRAFRFGLGSVYFLAFSSPWTEPLARTGVRNKAVDVRSGVIGGSSSERRSTGQLPLSGMQLLPKANGQESHRQRKNALTI